MDKLTISELNIKRGSFKRQLTDFDKYLKEISNRGLDDIIRTTLSTKLYRLELKFTQFDKIQNQIVKNIKY